MVGSVLAGRQAGPPHVAQVLGSDGRRRSGDDGRDLHRRLRLPDLHTLQGTKLPLDEGDRVVAMLAWDPVANDQRGIPEEDFERWRTTLRSVDDVGAFRSVERSMVTERRPCRAGRHRRDDRVRVS